jgi:hypothetical protein
MLTVHHLNNSRSQRVLWLLEELGVPYEIKRYERDPKTMLAPPELRAVHPLGKSPVITDEAASAGSHQLMVLCLGVLMIVLDTTIVNVALPSIRADLGFTETSLVWVVNAYMLTFGGFLLLGGRLGDLYGHRKLFLIGHRAVHAGVAGLRHGELAGLLVARARCRAWAVRWCRPCRCR